MPGRIVDSHPTPMVVLADDGGAVRLVNAAARRLLGGEKKSIDINSLKQSILTRERIVIDGEPAILLTLRAGEEPPLADVLEQLPIGVFVKDMEDGGRYVLFNAESGRIAGKDPKEIVGSLDGTNTFSPLADKFHREDLEVIGNPSTLVVSESVIRPEWNDRIVRTLKRGLALPDGTPPRYVLGVSYDVTAERDFERQLAHMARHDALTGLANQAFFNVAFEETVHGAGGRQVALFLVDIDHFKSINDRLGHHAGDAVLQEIGRRLAGFTDGLGVAARMGGDEFALVVAHPARGSLDALARKLYATLARPVVQADIEEPITVSIGAVPVEGQPEFSWLRKSADLALYAAKKQGRARFEVYHPDMRIEFDRRESLIVDLRRGIAEREFVWHYQPIVSLADNRVVAFEALVRWNHAERGLLGPAAFIDVAEQTGQICQIGEIMLETVFETAKAMPDHIGLAINLSVRQLQDEALPEKILANIGAAGLLLNRLEIEVTESIFLAEYAGALAVLERLKALGIRIVIDDFGSGYSSLSYLRTFPFDKLKLDRSFVSGMASSAGDEAITVAVAGIAAGFGLTSTAEGVETQAQLARLRAAGFDEAQGYLFSPPVPETGIPALLERLAGS